MSVKREVRFEWSVKINAEKENCLKKNRENAEEVVSCITDAVLILYCDRFLCARNRLSAEIIY